MAKKSKNEEYQLLILTKLDEHGQSIEKLRDEVVEIKTNHLAHIATDVELLKKDSTETSEWIKRHEDRIQENEQGSKSNRVAIWVAIITSVGAIIAGAFILLN